MKGWNVRTPVWFYKTLVVLILCIAVIEGVRFLRMSALRVFSQKISCPRCNVVILDIDVLRADAIQCAANTITPNLCKLIRQGTNFTNDVSQTFWSLPSELSTVTSLYPNTNQVWTLQTGSLASSSMTLASRLQQYGYDTYYSGHETDGLLSIRNGGLRGYAHIDFVTKKDLNWLDTLRNGLSTGKPIFFHIYASSPHMPYFLDPGQKPLQNISVPKGFPMYQKDFDPIWRAYMTAHVNDIFTPDTIAKHPEIFLADSSVRTQRIVDFFQLLDDENDYTQRYYSWDTIGNSYLQFVNPRNKKDAAFLHMMYESAVHALDANIGDFIDYLLRPEVAAHTIVVLTSAHGDAFGEHGTFGHLSIPYNELYRVPLSIKYPGGSGHEISGVVENLDIYPTIVEMVTGQSPRNLQGVSLVPLVSGVSARATSYAISMNNTDSFIIQNARYALVVYRDPRLQSELYDLIKDPTQQHDLAVKYPDIVKRYTRLLTQTAVAPELSLPMLLTPMPTGANKSDLIRSGYF